LIQAVPDFAREDADDQEVLAQLAAAFTPEDVQLCYQLAVVGRRDLDLAPEPRGGFEMVLLRMLAFRQLGDGAVANAAAVSAPRVVAPSVPPAQPSARVTTASSPMASAAPSDWLGMVRQLNLVGPASELAAHCTLKERQPGKLSLVLDAEGETFRRPGLEEKLRVALSTLLNEDIKLEFVEVTREVIDTPARRQQAAVADRQQAAVKAIHSDPNVQQMVDMFGAVVQPESIKPIE
jgi:DNA polymerase-3 subunit gamma/tau